MSTYIVNKCQRCSIAKFSTCLCTHGEVPHFEYYLLPCEFEYQFNVYRFFCFFFVFLFLYIFGGNLLILKFCLRKKINFLKKFLNLLLEGTVSCGTRPLPGSPSWPPSLYTWSRRLWPPGSRFSNLCSSLLNSSLYSFLFRLSSC